MTEIFKQSKSNSSLQTPLVSVIIDNYNYGHFLAEAIDSVLQQTYPYYELIVVDDGSTDNSREVIASYKDKLIAIFQSNGGQGKAFNTGIAKAKGEIICFLDADDYYHPDKLSKIVSGFQQHPLWMQISHGRTSVDCLGNPIGSGSLRHNQGDVSHLLLKWGRYAMGITSSLAYRRKVLDRVLPIPTIPEEAVGADTYLAATVPFYGQIGCIDEPLMFYRIHDNNLQARTDNVDYLIEQRKINAKYINQTVANLGWRDRFNLERDSDYRSLKAIQTKTSSLTETIQVIWLSWRESWAIGRSPKDTLERLLRRGLCTLFPDQGRSILRLGLRGYLRERLTLIRQLNAA